MPRLTEKETDKYRLWETIYLQKGEEYLSDKLKYFQGKVQEEETALLVEEKDPIVEYKDSFFYESQIAQYQESIKIITGIIKNNSKKRKLSLANYKSAVTRWFYLLIVVFRNLFLGSSKNKESYSAHKNNISNGTPIDEKNILEQRRTNDEIKNKIKLNINGTMTIITVLFFVTFVSALYENLIIVVISSVLFLSFLPRLALLIKQRKNRIIVSKEYHYLKLLAKKIDCNLIGSVIKGYMSEHRIEINYERNTQTRSLTISLSTKTINNLLVYFSTRNIPIQGLIKIKLEAGDFDKKINIFSNQDRIKFIIDEKVRLLLLEIYKIEKQFEFIIHDDKLYYYDYNPKISKEKTLLFYLKIIILFNELSYRLESI